MKKVNLILLFIIITNFACDNNEITIEDRIVGNWEYNFSVRGSEQISTLGKVRYKFKKDNSYIKHLDKFDWIDNGTWAYQRNDSTVFLTYQTYTTQISDTQHEILKIEKITDKELVFKSGYHRINNLNQFIEFEFIHYSKK